MHTQRASNKVAGIVVESFGGVFPRPSENCHKKGNARGTRRTTSLVVLLMLALAIYAPSPLSLSLSGILHPVPLGGVWLISRRFMAARI